MEMVYFIPPSQRRLALLAAQADTAPVLIYGASGTGKGAIARWIHQSGPRSAKAFLIANHDHSLASQIPQAQGGTLYIPEIGEWGMAEQKILLDFITSKSVSLPGQEDLRMLANTRIMATTSRALEGRAQAGMFNQQLLEKLNVFRLEMPPLNRRTDEFEDITMEIILEIVRELHKEHLRAIAPEAMNQLKAYDWPANIRELRNVLRLAVVAAKGDRIEHSDLPEFGHDRVDFRTTREEFEKIYILELLKTYGGDVEQTCRMSRMDKGTLLAKIKQYRLDEQLSVSTGS